MKASERIIAALPKNREQRINALKVIIRLAEGEAVHQYKYWTSNYTKLGPAPGVSNAVRVLDKAGVDYCYGNDAPRGGATGDYIKLLRRMPSAVHSLEVALEAASIP